MNLRLEDVFLNSSYQVERFLGATRGSVRSLAIPTADFNSLAVNLFE